MLSYISRFDPPPDDRYKPFMEITPILRHPASKLTRSHTATHCAFGPFYTFPKLAYERLGRVEVEDVRLHPGEIQLRACAIHRQGMV